MTPRAPRRLLLALGAAASLAAAGCGSASGAGDGDPAALRPAGAPIYLEAVVRPEGELKTDVEAVAKKVLRTDDPGGELIALFDKAVKDEGITFAEDVDPWLGDKVGVAVTSLSGREPDAFVVIPATDEEKARKALEKTTDKAVERKHKDVAYSVDSESKTAFGVVGENVVFGTEGGMRRAIDTSKGGDSLADADALKKTREAVTGDRIGFVYADVKRTFEAVLSSGQADPQTTGLLRTFAGQLPKTVGAALQPDQDAIRVDSVSIGGPEGEENEGGADALAALPGDAWLGAGVGDVGKTLERTIDQLASGGGFGGIAVEAALGQVKQATGLDVREDVLSWMGNAGIYVQGTSTSDLRGGLVVDSKDPAATRRALEGLADFARRDGTRLQPLRAAGVDVGYTLRQPGSPEIAFAAAGEKFVVAVGPGALEQALRPSTKLSDAPAFSAAAGKLGDGVRPSLFVDMVQVTRIVEGIAGSDPDFQRAKPYLDAFTAIVAGTKRDGDMTRGKLAVGLK